MLKRLLWTLTVITHYGHTLGKYGSRLAQTAMASVHFRPYNLMSEMMYLHRFTGLR